jgi:heptaprenyl diphosphate synthase
MKKTQKIVFIAILVAQALVLYIVESMLPVPFITPGAKLGLTNIITVVALYILSFKEVLAIVILRIVLSTLLGGAASSFFFSIAGGILSLLAMYFIKKLGQDKVSIIGVSVIGAVFHNVGQVIVAAFVVQNVMIISYLPVLLVAAVGTGFFVGLTGKYLLSHLRKVTFYGLTK